MIKTNKFELNKPKPKYPLKTRVKIINETYRNDEVGYIVKIKEMTTPNDFIRYIYYVQFRDKTIASFFEENIGDEHCVGYLSKALPSKLLPPKTSPHHIRGFIEHTAENTRENTNKIKAANAKEIGVASTAFTEADLATFDFYYESIKSELIKLESINLSPTQPPSTQPSPIREVTHKDVTSKHFIDWFFELDDWVGNDPEGFPFDMIVHNEYFSVYGYFNNNDKLDGIS